ncbi:dolichyl-phosphate-mannose--protein mannosyltransferase [Streptomyces sp. TR06-5]|uniref:dolichyl-phosphate-mannose--protein mannosyltransferase n=1 Tax=unclassified Streptomyces TaxID=2593676 RepID=UPI0039A2EBDD
MTTSGTAAEVQREQARPPHPGGRGARPRRSSREDGQQPPGLAERLVPPYPSPSLRPAALLGLPAGAAKRLARWSAWGGPLLVALVAGLLRFRHLGSPHAVIFDETYYAKDAWSLLRFGYEGTWGDGANEKILSGAGDAALSADHSYVVHPPAGKWIIALGEGLWGLDPFGWRFMTALLGTLSVLMLCRIGRRLFRSTLLGCAAGALMAVDGLHFVMSRTALLDLVVMFWVLAAFGCLLVDRDAARARLKAALPDDPGRPGDVRADAKIAERLGLGARPWRIAAGVCLGLACATKWNGLVVLAAFGLLTVLWDSGSRRLAGAGRPFSSMLRKDALPAFLSTVPVALATYLASWTGWFATDGGYHRDWATKEGAGQGWGLVPDALRSLWHYETQVYEFHVNLTDGHTYDSNPWSWLVQGRPVSYFYESPEQGEAGCTAVGGCAREVLALGTPLLWWAACLAVLYVLYRWLLRRDWRAGAILCGLAAGYLPWFHYQERTIFSFYAVVFVPFLCLAVAMVLGALAGPPGVTERRRVTGVVAGGVLVLLIVWNFVYFWPLYTGQVIPMDAWRHRMWLDTWI